MNDGAAGPRLLEALESVRAFHVEVAKLLRSADAYLRDEHQWEPLLASQCLSDLTYSVNSPDRWMPHHASRFFGIDDHTAAFVSVLMSHSRSDSVVTRMSEPLVYGGWVRYREPRTAKFQSTWLCRMWHWMHPWTSTGTEVPRGSLFAPLTPNPSRMVCTSSKAASNPCP